MTQTTRWALWLLIPISTTLTAVVADLDESCASPINPVIQGLPDPMVEYRTQRLIEAHPITLNIRNESSQVNLAELMALDAIELHRLERAYFDYYRRIDVANVRERFQVAETLGAIKGLLEFENTIVERLALYSNETFYDDESSENNSTLKEKLAQYEQDLEEISRKTYQNCSTWREMLEKDWQRYLLIGINENDLREKLKIIKRKTTMKLLELFAEEAETKQSEPYPPLESIASLYTILNKLSSRKNLLQEYYEWTYQGENFTLLNHENCPVGRLVPMAIQLAQLVIDAKQNLLRDHGLLLTGNFTTSTMSEKTSASLRSLVEARRDFARHLKSVNENDLHEQLLVQRELMRLDALIELQRLVLSRVYFHHNMTTQNADFFTVSNQVPVLPIENELERMNSELENDLKQQFQNCSLWSEMLGVELKNYLADQGDAENINMAIILIEATAKESKTQVTKLRNQLPDDFLRYLRLETEFEVIAAEKYYEALGDWAEELRKRMRELKRSKESDSDK